MKKTLVLFVILLGSVFCYAIENHGDSVSEQVCVTTKGVSGHINLQEKKVSFYNANSFAVTVSWEVYGYGTDGKSRKVAGGDKQLGANCSGSVALYGLNSVQNPYLEMTVWKCD